MTPSPSIVVLAIGATQGSVALGFAHKWFAWYAFDGFGKPVVTTVGEPTEDRRLPSITFTMRAQYRRWIVASNGAPRYL
jgi:hypothetical protein